ncbi:MAG: hypothetical protein ACOC3I_09495 [Verrucomicrobiota bacterium]
MVASRKSDVVEKALLAERAAGVVSRQVSAHKSHALRREVHEVGTSSEPLRGLRSLQADGDVGAPGELLLAMVQNVVVKNGV